MKQLTLSQITNAVGGILNVNCDDYITDVCTDTRKITKGCLFIAISGENFDGHDFINTAFENGAKAVMSSKLLHTDKPVILVKDTRIAYGKLASYYKGLFNIFCVGVTGSVGKTSTKEMISTVMSKKYDVLKTQGNFNNDIGLPRTLLSLEQNHTGAVIEMGMSSLGEISYLSKITKPDLAVITNVGVSHIENLKTRENILKAKLEILDGMKETSKVILNADNDMLFSVKDILGDRALYFGIDTPALVTASDIKVSGDSTEFKINYDNKSYNAVVGVVGVHNVYNALAGFLVGVQIGLSPEKIIEAIAEYKNANMRQTIKDCNGIKVIEDCYNASPDSMKSALEVISSVECDGKRIAVLGDMLELGSLSSDMHTDVGKLAAESNIDMLLCYGELSENIIKGAKQNGLFDALHFSDKDKLADYIRKSVKKGDAIIFKASRGMRLEEVIKLAFEQ